MLLIVQLFVALLAVLDNSSAAQGTLEQNHRVLIDGKSGSGAVASALTSAKIGGGGRPQFDTNVARNVTIAVGQTAFLHCRVSELGDKEVSWMRKRDMHILSVGILMYTSDLRFQVIHPEKSDNWTLQIKSPQKRDSGIYECQVSTEPKMYLNYSLNVIEARARITGAADIIVKTGSSLTLTCVMSQGPHNLGTVNWYRGDSPVTTSILPDNDIETEPRIMVETEWSDALTSRLKINRIRSSDSGNYSCVPTAAKRASVNVHVINGYSITLI